MLRDVQLKVELTAQVKAAFAHPPGPKPYMGCDCPLAVAWLLVSCAIDIEHTKYHLLSQCSQFQSMSLNPGIVLHGPPRLEGSGKLEIWKSYVASEHGGPGLGDFSPTFVHMFLRLLWRLPSAFLPYGHCFVGYRRHTLPETRLWGRTPPTSSSRLNNRAVVKFGCLAHLL